MDYNNSWNANFEIGFRTESALKCRPEQLKTIRRITQPLVKHWLVKKGQTNSKQPCSLFPKARKKPILSSQKTWIFVWKISGKWKKKKSVTPFFCMFWKNLDCFPTKDFRLWPQRVQEVWFLRKNLQTFRLLNPATGTRSMVYKQIGLSRKTITYTQSVLIRNGPIRNTDEIWGILDKKEKKLVFLMKV